LKRVKKGPFPLGSIKKVMHKKDPKNCIEKGVPLRRGKIGNYRI